MGRCRVSIDVIHTGIVLSQPVIHVGLHKVPQEIPHDEVDSDEQGEPHDEPEVESFGNPLTNDGFRTDKVKN